MSSQRQTTDNKQEGEMGKWARYYDFLMFFMTLGQEKALRRMTVELAGLKPGEKVLEIGSGTGTLTLAAKRKVGATGEADGIDVAPEMVAVATRKATRRRVDAKFQVGTMQNLPFEAARFDAALCSFMIFHMPEDVRRKGFAEIHRVLKPGGRLLILDFGWPGKSAQQYHVRTLVPVLKEFSFSDVELAKADFMTWLLGKKDMGLWYVRGVAT